LAQLELELGKEEMLDCCRSFPVDQWEVSRPAVVVAEAVDSSACIVYVAVSNL
jgi:hypothetical protein